MGKTDIYLNHQMLRILLKKIKMLDDDILVKKMGQASRKRLENRFAPQSHYEALMKIFNEAVKNRK